MTEIARPIRSRLLAVVPWSAAGPGWANAGARAIYEDLYHGGEIRVREEVAYLNGTDAEPGFDAEEILAWEVGMQAKRVLERRWRRKE